MEEHIAQDGLAHVDSQVQDSQRLRGCVVFCHVWLLFGVPDSAESGR